MNMLDHLTAAMQHRNPRYSSANRFDLACEYFRNHRKELAPAFDLWLVKVGDSLAYQAGTPEVRFATRVVRMIEANEDAARLAHCSQLHYSGAC